MGLTLRVSFDSRKACEERPLGSKTYRHVARTRDTAHLDEVEGTQMLEEGILVLWGLVRIASHQFTVELM